MSFFRKAGEFIKDAINQDDEEEQQQQQQYQSQEDRPQEQHHESGGGDGAGGGNSRNRFQSSFAPSNGDIKWYVDGASYFHAVSMALERKSYAQI